MIVKKFQFYFKERVMDIEGEKLWKQDKDQRNKLENKLENGTS